MHGPKVSQTSQQLRFFSPLLGHPILQFFLLVSDLFDVLGSFPQYRHLGRPLVVLKLGNLPAKHLEAVLEVVATLSLQDVVRGASLFIVRLQSIPIV